MGCDVALRLTLALQEELVQALPVRTIVSLVKVHIHYAALLLFHIFTAQDRCVALLDYGHVVSIRSKCTIVEDRLASLTPLLPLLLRSLHSSCAVAIDWSAIGSLNMRLRVVG